MESARNPARRYRAAIDELGYTPNGLARSLVLKTTNTIGVVVDTLCDAYFFDLIQAIEEEVGKLGYDVLFCSAGNSTEKKSSYINFFMQERVDGILIYGSALDDKKLITKLARSHFPFALIENDMGSLNVNNILLNNQYGSEVAVDYLFQCGCRNIAHVAGDENRQAARRRQKGYLSAMKKHGASNIMIISLDGPKKRVTILLRNFFLPVERQIFQMHFFSVPTRRPTGV